MFVVRWGCWGWVLGGGVLGRVVCGWCGVFGGGDLGRCGLVGVGSVGWGWLGNGVGAGGCLGWGVLVVGVRVWSWEVVRCGGVGMVGVGWVCIFGEIGVDIGGLAGGVVAWEWRRGLRAGILGGGGFNRG